MLTSEAKLRTHRLVTFILAMTCGCSLRSSETDRSCQQIRPHSITTCHSGALMWFLHSEYYAGIGVSGWRKSSVPSRCLLPSLRAQIRLNGVFFLSDLIILMIWKSRCVTVERLISDTLDGRFLKASRHDERVRVFRQGILACSCVLKTAT